MEFIRYSPPKPTLIIFVFQSFNLFEFYYLLSFDILATLSDSKLMSFNANRPSFDLLPRRLPLFDNDRSISWICKICCHCC